MVDPSNSDVYISDTGNNVIRKVEWETGILTTVAGVAGMGLAGYTGEKKESGINEFISTCRKEAIRPSSSSQPAGFNV